MKRLLAPGLALVLGVLLSELILQAVCRLSPEAENLLFPIPYALPDSALGTRPNPKYPGHDRKGFRNRRVPRRVQVVALGDSQTYGFRSARADAWPQQLERLGGLSTYNMGCPQYGPGHSLILLDEALAFDGELIIQAVYSGNDLFDAFSLVYLGGKLPELKSADPAILESIERAQQAESLEQLAERASDRPAEDPVPLGSLRGFLSAHSALYCVLGVAKREALRLKDGTGWESIKRQALDKPESFEVFEGRGLRKIFRSRYRLTALDPTDPRIAEGRRITLAALGRMQARLARERVEFLVLLIPTCELVFEDAVREAQVAMPEEYELLLSCEKEFWRSARQHLSSSSIRFVDALPALRACLRRGEQPYRIDYDGHPTAVGHRAIAEEILLALGKR